MPVHLYGHPSDIGAINAIAQRHDLPVLVDACQAVGCRYLSDRSAPLGDGAAFSFYPAKNLGAFGDGGIVVTDRPEIDEKIRMLRNLGSKAKYQHDLRGFNRRLDSLQAAVLEVKLRHLDEATERRRAAARLYGEQLAGLDLVVPAEQGWAESVYHLYVIEVDDRDGLGDHLSACDIGNGVHYPVPIHRQPAFASLGYRHGQFPVTERLADRVLSLPMHPMLQPNDVRTVTEEVRRGLESPQRDRAS